MTKSQIIDCCINNLRGERRAMLRVQQNYLDKAKALQQKAGMLEMRIEEKSRRIEERKLEWLIEFCNTPCWRYRVKSC